jgi:hypothetical protein
MKMDHKIAQIIKVTLTFLFTIAVIILPTLGCELPESGLVVDGSAEVKEYILEYAEFSQLTIIGPIPVEIHQANKNSITVSINANLFEYLQVTHVVDLLRVELDPAVRLFRNLNISLSIEMPALRSLTISRAGKCVLHEFNMNMKESLDITVSEGSNAEISILSAQYVSVFTTSGSQTNGTLKCDDGRITALAASRVGLKGECQDMVIDASGASQANLAEYWVKNAMINARGASSVNLNVGGKLSVDLSGASSLTYGGDPTLGKVLVAAGSKLIRR